MSINKVFDCIQKGIVLLSDIVYICDIFYTHTVVPASLFPVETLLFLLNCQLQLLEEYFLSSEVLKGFMVRNILLELCCLHLHELFAELSGEANFDLTCTVFNSASEEVYLCLHDELAALRAFVLLSHRSGRADFREAFWTCPVGELFELCDEISHLCYHSEDREVGDWICNILEQVLYISHAVICRCSLLLFLSHVHFMDR